MSSRPTMRIAMPKPRRATLATMIVLATLGIVNALLMNWGGFSALFEWLAVLPGTLPLQVYRVFTAIVLTSPSSYGHLLFSLFFLYLFSPTVEERIGSKRWLALFLGGGALGSVLGALGNLTGIEQLSSHLMFGPSAAIAALVVAWSMQNPNLTVQMFFVLPMRGAWMKWITLAFCVLGLLYSNAPPEGRLADFGGFLVGWLFGGQPSLVRAFFLKKKLGKVESERERLRREGPSLRVVYGGLADELDLDRGQKRPSDKPDKRTLN